MSRASAVVAISLLFVASSGCTAGEVRAARTRFANEFNCAPIGVTAEALGAGSVRVDGCHRSAVYVCVSTRIQGLVCTLESEHAVAATTGELMPPADLPASSTRMGVQVSGATVPALTLQLAGILIRLTPDSGTTPPSRYAALVSLPDGATPPRQCNQLRWGVGRERIDAPLAGMPGGNPQFALTSQQLAAIAADHHARVLVCGRTADVPPTQRGDIRAYMDELGQVFERPTAPPAALDEAIRSRRDGVLACVGQDTIGLSIRWDAGTVEVGLQGALAGTPEEACVQRLLADLPAPSSTPSGRTVQVVSR